MKKELERACKNHQLVRMIYLDQNGQTTKRTLRPLHVTNHHLKAYCMVRRAPRVFALENILAIEPVVNRHAV
ncbi:WYL domain-containing protein [Brevibacillus sp. B_LB10_24]|uniref:WYL domain-containing protein n=1 Tax=Brevibacillus sp. B_LB10_24 TaxID=3380645 RepID=UPI0038BA07A4